jgi:hypothetical protein
VGADVDGRGQPLSFAKGLIDEVRLSRCARYEEPFQPSKRFEKDGQTLLLLHFDKLLGDLTPDTSGYGHHGRVKGGTCLVEVKRGI